MARKKAPAPPGDALKNEQERLFIQLANDEIRKLTVKGKLPTFEVTTPMQMPGKKGPAIDAMNFIGGEDLRLIGMTQTGSLILKPQFASPFSEVYSPPSHALENLTGFMEWWTTFSAPIEAKVNDMMQSALNEQQKAEAAARRDACPDYGSW